MSHDPIIGFQERVRAEEAELAEKTAKLAAFLQSPIFRALSPVERDLLTEQHVHMSSYGRVLNARIAIFGRNGSEPRLDVGI